MPLGRADSAAFEPYTAKVERVSTEGEAATKAGFQYVRFTVTDMNWPQAETVDRFLDFLRGLPKGQANWFHFHCHAGHGRTTSFMVMYEILRGTEGLEDIVANQVERGGTNLLALSDDDDYEAELINDRARKVQLFYEFVKETQPLLNNVSWSDWLKAGGEE